MTQALSKERLEEIINVDARSNPEVREMARFMLAAHEQEPVGWTDEQELRDVDKAGCGYLFKANPITPHADLRRVIKLYTHPAPSIPAAVPDLSSVISELEKVHEWILNTLPVPTKSAVPNARRVRDVLNACRTAMLQAEPQNAPQNIPVNIPEGYALVPLIAFPSQWAAGQKAFDAAGINKVDAVYKAMVAAAPKGV